MSEQPGIVRSTAYDSVRDRCRSLGLPTWRCDTAGSIIEEPTEPGLLGLWLRSGGVGAMVQTAASEWLARPEPELIPLFPGCWLIPLLEEQRRRKVGVTMAMALGAGAAEDPAFSLACKAAHLDAFAARNVVQAVAVYDGTSAQRTATLLRWALRDQLSLAEYQSAVNGFTIELTDAYETIDLLYGLGRAMTNIDHPSRFVNQVCERLSETMGFGWLAARFVPVERIAGTVASKLVVRGHPGATEAEIDALMVRLLDDVAPTLASSVVSGVAEFAEDSQQQLLVQPIVRNGELAGVLVGGDKHAADPQVSSYDMRLLEASASYIGAFLENAGLYTEQRSMFLGMLKALGAAIDAKDRYTCGHSERVAHLAALLGQAAGLGPDVAERLRICGLVHDLGKIGVPEAVLCKAGKLTEQEFALIKLHPEIGHRILGGIPRLEDVLPGVLHHHERWDGAGYPHGLRAEQIPLFARVVGLVDTFDAMSSTRAYRSAMPREKVLAEISRCSGTQFDPAMVKAFTRVDLKGYDEMVARHARELGDAEPPRAIAA